MQHRPAHVCYCLRSWRERRAAFSSTFVHDRSAVVLVCTPRRRCAAWRRAFQWQASSALITLRSPQSCCCALPGSNHRQACLGWALEYCQALYCTSPENFGCLQQPAPLGCVQDAQIDEVLVRQVGQRPWCPPPPAASHGAVQPDTVGPLTASETPGQMRSSADK